MGFVVGSDTAALWDAANEETADVVRRYLTGSDLNDEPDSRATQWVVDFFDRPRGSAERYRAPYRTRRGARASGTGRKSS